jgi:hypothetical protein
MAPRASSKPTREEDDSQRLPGERITVALIPKVASELQHLLSTTGLSKTDVVNRAISLYEFIQSQTDAGKAVIIRDQETGETQLVKFL